MIARALIFLVLLTPSAQPAQNAGIAAPNFANDVAPILYKNCAPCHHPNGVGPFALLTYSDAKKHATQIADVTRRRYMPPWPPQAGYGDFQAERRLSEAEIQTISDWVRAGAPQGSPSAAPPIPHFSDGWQLGMPDLILTASHAFTMPASGPDLFWNFVFEPGLKKSRYIRAIEIQPNGQQAVSNVHHANLLLDRNGSVRKLEPAPGSGFAGMDLIIDRNPFDPDSHFLFWKPGTAPYAEPDGLSWRLDPGNLLVLNTHLQPTGKPENVTPQVGIYFTDKPPTRFPILVQLEHDGALHIPAGVRDFLVSDDFCLPVDSDVLAIYPHAHYRGKQLEAYATLPDGSRQWLIRIPDWDLNWQAVYRYREPVFLPAGSVVSMRYRYDNSSANPRNPNHPAKVVNAGNQATDEMGHLWLQLLPRGRGDHRRPIQEALMRHRIEKYPGDFSARLNLGAILLSRLDAQGAIESLQAAISLDPKRPEAHNMLGSAFRNVGRFADAMAQFRLALVADPSFVDARYNLATALVRAGQMEEAIANFRQVADAFPASVRIQTQFGELLARNGRYQEALVQFNKALALDPSDRDARQARQMISERVASAATQQP